MPTSFLGSALSARLVSTRLISALFCVFALLLSIPPAQAAPQAVSITVGGDNLTRLLWNNPDGSTSLWKLNADGTVASQTPYGPYSSWTAQTLAAGANSAPRFFWNNTSGQMSLWNTTDPNPGASCLLYGPYSGWSGAAIAVGGSNAARLLWNNTNGQISLWNFADANPAATCVLYGPYGGWTGKTIAAGADSRVRILWNNADGRVSVWNQSDANPAATCLIYGPYSGWSGRYLGVGPNNAARLVWVNTNGQVSLWNLADASPSATCFIFTPAAGYTAAGMAVGADNLVRLLWSGTDGTAQVWTVAADGTYTSTTYSSTPSLTAAATGTSKVTLYWNGASGASSYNVSRSTTSGGPYTQVASNVTTANTGPGLANAFMYSDMAGLTTGTEYFYTISAVYSGLAGPQSNEVSASPAANAIPWDTGNAAQIVAQVTSSVASALEPDIDPDTGDTYPATVGILTACGPDGVLYQGNYADGTAATAYPSSAYYDSSSGTIIYGDGTAASAPAEGDDNADAPASSPSTSAISDFLMPHFQISELYNYRGNNTGIWRKILSVPGFWGASGTCGLPNLNDPNSVVLAVHSFPPGAVDQNNKPLTFPYSDSGDIYFGGSVNYTGPVPIGPDGKATPYSNYELDLGLQASAHLASTSVPGWVPVINPTGKLNSAVGNTRSTAVTGVTLSQINGNIKGNKIYAVNETRMQFITPNFANIADQSVALHLAPPFGSVAGGKIFVAPFIQTSNGLGLGTPVSYSAATLVYYARGWRKSARNNGSGSNLFSIKRTNSIAQTLLDATHQNYPPANGPTESNLKSFLIDSSAIRGAYWGNNGDSRGVELNSNGSWIPWTDDSSQSLHSGAYPNSKFGGYGYVTWVKQNGFTWETNINLKANHTLP